MLDGLDEAAVMAHARDHAQEHALFQSLVDWMSKRGGRIAPLALQEQAGLRGVAAAMNIAAGTEVLSVPRACWLEIGDRCGAAQSEEAPGDVNDKALLAWRLCGLQTQSDPTWRTYVDLLPRDCSNLPLCYSSGCLEALPSFTQKYILQERERLRRARETLARRDLRSPEPEFDRFVAAYACVLSRAFVLETKEKVLVPIADMLNHSFEPSCRIDMDVDGCRFIALRDLRAGEELTWTYVRAPNSVLFLVYGFCVDQHPEDMISACGPAGTASLFHRMAEDGLSIANLRQWATFVPSRLDSDACRHMFTAIRSSVRQRFDRPGAAPVPSPLEDPQASTPETRDEELAVLRELDALCDMWLMQLCDGASPHGGPDAAIARAISTLVASQTSIIRYYRRLAHDATEALNCVTRAEAAARLGKMPNGGYIDQLMERLETLWPAPAMLGGHSPL